LRYRLTTEGIKLRNAAIILLHALGFSPPEISRLFHLAEKTVTEIYRGQGARIMVGGTASIMTCGEAARFLRVHVNTVRRWADAGKIPSVRLGDRDDRRFRREDLEALLRAGKGKVRELRVRGGTWIQ